MKLDSFRHLYIEELRNLFDGEEQLLAAFPALAEAAVLPELRQTFARQVEQTKVRLDRLAEIFDAMKTDPLGSKCHTMTGLLAECNDLTAEEPQADPGVLDAALIAATQKIAHFQIACYGCARTFAEILSEAESAKTLQFSLNEEGDVNRKLNRLALRSVNPEAAEATDAQASLSEAVVSALDAVDQ
jgi:ferritin-like metal-binding protein YciE